MTFRRNAPSKPMQAIDTVRLDRRVRDGLLKSLVENRQRKGGNNARRWPRFTYKAEHIVVRITQASGAAQNYLVVPRNLSVGGVAFIHGQFIYSGSRCEMILPTSNSTWFRVGGKIVRCIHAAGMIHEVSVEFDERIDPYVFLPPDAEIEDKPIAADAASSPDRDNEHEKTGKKVRGTVLLVDPEASGRALFAKWLRQRGMVVLDSSDGETAIKWLEEGRVFELAVIHLPRAEAANTGVVRRVRDRGFKAPIVAISADSSDEARATAIAAGCNAFLPKTCGNSTFSSAIDQLLAASAAPQEQRPNEPRT